MSEDLAESSSPPPRVPPRPPAIPVFRRKDIIYAGIISFIAWTFASFDAQIFGTLLPVISDAFEWTTAFGAYVASWVTLGAVIIGFTVGPMIDYWGRKTALFVTTGGAAISSALAAFALGPISLVLFRSLSGFGQSEQAVNSAYLNELFSKKRRGLLYSLVQAGYPAGVMLAALTAAIGLKFFDWRGVFLVATAPLIIIFILRRWLKESPEFLHARHVRALKKFGDLEAARQYGKANGVNAESQKGFTYRQLFNKDLRKHTIWMGLGFFMHFFGSQQLTVLSTTILVAKGLDLSSALWVVVGANILTLASFVAFGWIGDKIGRRETIVICYIVAGFLYAYLALFANGLWIVAVAYAVGLIFDQGAAAPLFAYLGESYPSRVRGSGATLIATVGPLGGIIGGFVYAYLQTVGLDAAQAAVTGAASSAAAGLCFLGARRVRPRRALREIAT